MSPRVAEIDIPEYVDRYFREFGPGRMRIVALTYQFDPQAFETRFERIFRRGAIRIDVVTGDDADRPRREPYRIWRANWRGTFHPKLLVLMANHRVAVGVGSANLTWGGLGENLECWHFLEDSVADRSVLAGVRRFLQTMLRQRVLSHHLELEEVIRALPNGDKGTVISTLYGSVLNQVAEKVRRPVERLDILSPVNCDPGSTLKKVLDLTGTREVHLFTNMKTVPAVVGCNGYWNLTPPRSSDEEEKVCIYWSMHAKMYAFWNSGGVDLFWGSANLSQSAWLRTGHKANLDLLVHSRITENQWTNLRDRLPARHSWTRVRPAKEGKFPDEAPPKGEEWRILHAVWDGRALFLEANRSGDLLLWLRRPEGRAVQVTLEFEDMQAKVPAETVRRLDFCGNSIPGGLEFTVNHKGVWHALPLNVPSEVTAGLESPDVVTRLFWRYTGRLLPGSKSGNTGGATPSVEIDPWKADSEEEELTRSFHQGKLDRFVLQWRLTVRRITACSGRNRDLMQHRLDEARHMIGSEAQECPGEWPPNRRAFVEKLFADALAGRI